MEWQESEGGLRFRQHGVIWSSAEFTAARRQVGAASSIEIWLQPGFTNDSGTVFTFVPGAGSGFRVHQYHADIALEIESGGTRRSAFYVGDILSKGRSVFITITSGAQGTWAYVDGVAIKMSRRFRFSSASFDGRLVIGTSPFADDCWAGQLRGLAFHQREFTPAEVLQRYRQWTQSGHGEVLLDGGTVALYHFDERSGSAVHDHGRSQIDLAIPPQFTLLRPILLEPLRQAFRGNWGFWQDVLVNIVGFVPFGFFVTAYLSEMRKPWAAFVTILMGAMISLSIEVLQMYLPTRSSQTIDVMMNSLGTLLGVLLFHWTPAQALYRRGAECMLHLLDLLWSRQDGFQQRKRRAIP